MKIIQEHLRQTISQSKMLAIPLCLDALFGHFKQSANKHSLVKSRIPQPTAALSGTSVTIYLATP